jgi:hypothetical protein
VPKSVFVMVPFGALIEMQPVKHAAAIPSDVILTN